jgi:outer membrane protein assembly factor BamB
MILAAIAAVTLFSGCGDASEPVATAGGWQVAAASFTPRIDAVEIQPDIVYLVAGASGVKVVLDPATGREQARVTAPRGGRLQRRESVITTVTLDTDGTPRTPVFDAATGQLLFTLSDVRGVGVLATLDTVVVSGLGTTELIAHNRRTGAEVWRRSLAGFPCGVACGFAERVDVIGDVLTFIRQGVSTAALFRVTSAGQITAAAIDLAAFRSGIPPQFATRQSVTAPVVLATDRAMTAFDATSGATLWQTTYRSAIPAGFGARAQFASFTGDGRWLATRMGDSVNTDPAPLRDLVFNTATGQLATQRSLTVDEGNDLFVGRCGASGTVRVLSDLRMEYSDAATGRRTLFPVTPSLGDLRATPTVDRFIEAVTGTIGDRLIIYSPVSGLLTAYGCAA